MHSLWDQNEIVWSYSQRPSFIRCHMTSEFNFCLMQSVSFSFPILIKNLPAIQIIQKLLKCSGLLYVQLFNFNFQTFHIHVIICEFEE